MTDRSFCPTCGTVLPTDAPEALCPRCLLKVALPGPEERRGFVAPQPAALAPLFPQLVIDSLIGQGGMGAVYKARQVKLDRPVALKVLPQREDDPAFAERFLREARALAKLQHPNIVTVHDFGDAGGFYFLLMEYVDGANLREVMKGGPVEPAQAIKVVTAVAEALAYAHQNELVHRDVKPENILIDRLGRVKIADFGLAKLLGPVDVTLTDAGSALGTPHYMAPEQLEKPATVDHRADIYALGVVFYELLTGELPLGRFAPPSAKAGIDRRLDDIVLKALEREPDKRFQSAGETVAALGALERSPAPPPVEDEPIESPYEWMSLVGVLVGGLAVAFTILLVKSGWVAAGLVAVDRLAAAVTWRRSRRPLVGQALALSAVAASIAILAADRGNWWMLFLIWGWFGQMVYTYFRPRGATGEDIELGIEGLTDREKRIVVAMKRFEDEDFSTIPEIDADQQQDLREACRLPAEDRILALRTENIGSDAAFSTVVTTSGVYLHRQHGETADLTVLPFREFPIRTFVNHGRSVYVGNGQTVQPDPGKAIEQCETLCNVLNTLKKVV